VRVRYAKAHPPFSYQTLELTFSLMRFSSSHFLIFNLLTFIAGLSFSFGSAAAEVLVLPGTYVRTENSATLIIKISSKDQSFQIDSICAAKKSSVFSMPTDRLLSTRAHKANL